jgi:3-carboxy-cis,cis-muconate cycloisomerase
MPHKRNPVACVHALAAATRIPGLLATVHAGSISENERALGGWQAELAVVPDIAECLGSALDFLDTIGASLEVDGARMAANLAAYGAGEAHNPKGLETAIDELLDGLSPEGSR